MNMINSNTIDGISNAAITMGTNNIFTSLKGLKYNQLTMITGIGCVF